MDFDALNVRIQDNTFDALHHHVMSFSRKTVDEMGTHRDIVRTKFIDRLQVGIIGMRAVDDFACLLMDGLKSQFHPYIIALVQFS